MALHRQRVLLDTGKKCLTVSRVSRVPRLGERACAATARLPRACRWGWEAPPPPAGPHVPHPCGLSSGPAVARLSWANPRAKRRPRHPARGSGAMLHWNEEAWRRGEGPGALRAGVAAARRAGPARASGLQPPAAPAGTAGARCRPATLGGRARAPRGCKLCARGPAGRRVVVCRGTRRRARGRDGASLRPVPRPRRCREAARCTRGPGGLRDKQNGRQVACASPKVFTVRDQGRALRAAAGGGAVCPGQVHCPRAAL